MRSNNTCGQWNTRLSGGGGFELMSEDIVSGHYSLVLEPHMR